MKTFLTMGYKKIGIITISLAVCLLVMTSCQKGTEKPETNKEISGLLLEEKSSDIVEDANELEKAESKYLPFVEKSRTPWLAYDDLECAPRWEHRTLLYKYADIYTPFTVPSLPVEEISIWLTNMQPERVVSIISAMNDENAVDVLLKTEEMAKQAGTQSLVMYWLSLMAATLEGAARADELQRKMVVSSP